MLNAAVIGLGVGQRHVEVYSDHPGIRLAALCDVDEEKLSEFGKLYPEARLCDSPQTVLTDPSIDVVSIASFDSDHYNQTIMALNNDKSVLVEKPICLKLSEMRGIHRILGKKEGLTFGCNLPLRRNPRFMNVRTMIERGELGELYYIEGAYQYGRLEKLIHGWRGAMPDYSVTLGGGIHMADLVLWFSGDVVEEVFAYGNKIATRGSIFQQNDLTVASLRFKSGLIAKLTSNFSNISPHFHELNVYGTKGTFFNRRGDGVLHLSPNDERLLKDSYLEYDKKAVIKNFADALVGAEEQLVKPNDIFDAMAVCFAIDESVEKGIPVSVESFS